MLTAAADTGALWD